MFSPWLCAVSRVRVARPADDRKAGGQAAATGSRDRKAFERRFMEGAPVSIRRLDAKIRHRQRLSRKASPLESSVRPWNRKRNKRPL